MYGLTKLTNMDKYRLPNTKPKNPDVIARLRLFQALDEALDRNSTIDDSEVITIKAHNEDYVLDFGELHESLANRLHEDLYDQEFDNKSQEVWDAYLEMLSTYLTPEQGTEDFNPDNPDHNRAMVNLTIEYAKKGNLDDLAKELYEETDDIYFCDVFNIPSNERAIMEWLKRHLYIFGDPDNLTVKRPQN